MDDIFLRNGGTIVAEGLNRIRRMMFSPVKNIFHNFFTSKSLSLGLLSCLVGLLTGGGIWLFKFLFNLIHQTTYIDFLNRFSDQKDWFIALIPLAGGIAVGLLMKYLGPKEKIHGTAGIIQAVEVSGGRLRYKNLPINTSAAVISLGSGASVGPEDPSVQIGANIGSMIGKFLHLADSQIIILVAAGAGAAIAAAFNAPIAGVFFALEIVIGDLSGRALGMILIATVASSAFTQAISGAQPAFLVQAYSMKSAWELFFYVGLGFLAGPISALYIHLLYWMQDFFHRWKIDRWLQTAFTGLCVGLVGIVLPQVLGVGYETISQILTKAQSGFWLLVVFVFGKLILTTFSIGGGFVGGVFAPSLFIGAALGGAYGIAMSTLFPSLGISPSAYALVGMAAVLAGSIHAPLTASLLLFEMTADYRIILPLMLAVAISMLVSQKIQPNSVYSLGLARKGFHLNRGKEIDVLATLQVKEVMKKDYSPLLETDSIENAKERLTLSHDNGLPVFSFTGELCGILTLSDIEKSGDSEKIVADLCQKSPLVTYPNDSLSSALTLMSELSIGQLPVVNPDSPKKMVGILRREEVIDAYALALKKRLNQRHANRKEKLDAVTPDQVQIQEFVVGAKSLIAGKLLKEIQLPAGCVVASIRHRGHVNIPNGNSEVHKGDALVIVMQGEMVEQVRSLF